MTGVKRNRGWKLLLRRRTGHSLRKSQSQVGTLSSSYIRTDLQRQRLGRQAQIAITSL